MSVNIYVLIGKAKVKNKTGKVKIQNLLFRGCIKLILKVSKVTN